RLARLGSGCATAKRAARDVPPPGAGVTTVTDTLPALLRSLAGIAAVRLVAPTNVVVRGAPFHCTTDDDTKPAPVTVSVNPLAPTVAAPGFRLLSVGAGLFTVKLAGVDVPPPGVGVARVTADVPAVSRSEAGMVVVSVVPFTNVVVRVTPFHCTADEATKLLPVTVSVKGPVPTAALLGLRPVSVGTGLLTVKLVTLETPP